MEADRKALELLHEQISDADEVKVQHFLYFPTEATAVEVADRLREDGLIVEHAKAAVGDSWLVLAQIMMRPTSDELEEKRAEFEELADVHGGEYDGWEAEVPAH